MSGLLLPLLLLCSWLWRPLAASVAGLSPLLGPLSLLAVAEGEKLSPADTRTCRTIHPFQ